MGSHRAPPCVGGLRASHRAVGVLDPRLLHVGEDFFGGGLDDLHGAVKDSPGPAKPDGGADAKTHTRIQARFEVGSK